MSYKAEKKIYDGIATLKIRGYAYSVSYLSKFRLRPVNGLGTIGISNDGYLVYDPEFIMRLEDPEEILGLLQHELGHVTYRTWERRGDRDFRIWNIASDAKINSDLLEAGFKLPEGGVMLNPEFKTLTIEEIYDAILREAPKRRGRKEKEEREKEKEGGEKGRGRKGGERSREDGNSGEDEGGDEGEGYGDEEEEQGGDEGDLEGISKVVRGDVNDVRRELEKDKITDELAKDGETLKKFEEETLKELMASGGYSPKSLEEQVRREPHFVREMVRKLLNKIRKPLSVAMSDSFREALASSWDWEFPHLLSEAVGEYLPSESEWERKIIIALDVSGSVSDEKLKKFADLAVNLMRRFTDDRITLVQADDRITSIVTVKNPKALKVLEVVRAGMGTNYKPVFDYARRERADLVIYFTDLNCDLSELEKLKRFQLIWVVPRQDVDEIVDGNMSFGSGRGQKHIESAERLGKLITFDERELNGNKNGNGIKLTKREET